MRPFARHFENLGHSQTRGDTELTQMAVPMSIVLKVDETHVIPLIEVSAVGHGSEKGTGELTWHPSTGARFRIVFPGRYRVPPPDGSGHGAGSLFAMSRKPQFVATTPDGLQCRLYSTVNESTTKMSTARPTQTVIAGQASIVEIEIPRSSPIAFAYDTPDVSRTFFCGLEAYFPQSDEVSYREGDSEITRGRGWFDLTRDGEVRVYRGSPKYSKAASAWLVRNEQANCDPWSLYSGDYVSFTFLSFLAGRYVPMLWHDHFVREGIIARTYYGTKTIDVDANHHNPPLPISGLEAFKHSREVFERVPQMFDQYHAIAEQIDLGWILGPLWSAADSFADERLSLNCVAIERLATSFNDLQKAIGERPEKKVFLSKEQSDAIKEALREALHQLRDVLTLDGDQTRICERRIEQINQPPNSDKLLGVFDYLGIPVTEKERETLENRNRCFHGRRTLVPGGSIEDTAVELLRCDIITMLMHKGTLGLLKYGGPYVDYAQRTTGNYPIEKFPPSQAPQ